MHKPRQAYASTSSTTEAIAYCQDRRAFLIIDPPVHPGPNGGPPTGFTPDDMVKYITGANLTKGLSEQYLLPGRQ
jgi:hypothetical protein